MIHGHALNERNPCCAIEFADFVVYNSVYPLNFFHWIFHVRKEKSKCPKLKAEYTC